MWRDRILEAKKEKNISTKSMADYAHMPEKTVARILTGKTQAPYVDTVIILGASVGLSSRDIFSEAGVVVGDQDLMALQTEVARLTAEVAQAQADAAVLKAEVAALTAENDLLRLKLDHKDEVINLQKEIITLGNYCNKLKPEN